MLFPEATTELLARCHFPPAGSPLDCAVSGGADSVTLMALAIAHGCKVTAYHVDHQIRAGSQGEAGVVARAAEYLGAAFVPLVVACAPGPNLEARARRLRHGVLPPEVALGHTADDRAETMIINLLRGAARDGLAGMQPGPRHPILEIRREETQRFARSLRIDLVEDPSNEDPAFVRNRVRHELLPLMGEIAGRDLIPLLARQSELLHDESTLLDELAAAIDPGDVGALRSAPPALSRRALRTMLRDWSPEGYVPDARAIERVLAVVRGEVLACEITGGVRVRRSQGRLFVEPTTEPSPDRVLAEPSNVMTATLDDD